MAVSVLVAIRDRFSGRILEWYVAAQLLMWGLILLAPNDVFTPTSAFSGFHIPEETLGLAMLAMGVIRIGALIINGAVPNVTPFFRIGGAFLGCGVWFYISMNLFASGYISTWIAAWPMACVAEFINLYRASQDARVGVRKATSMKRATHGGRT
jgi:hypothetical protein